MELHFLGTGAGMPSKFRNTSSLAIQHSDKDGSIWLIDCGEATQHQILHTSLKPRKVTKIFITHLHGDHIFGLPGFLSSRSFLDGDSSVTIYGPKGIQQWMEQTLTLSKTHIKYPIVYETIFDGARFEVDDFVVTVRELQHPIPSFGFRFDEKQGLPMFLPDKAIALGIPKGPLFGKLKRGEDVTLENGQLVKSSEVTIKKEHLLSMAVIGDTKKCEATTHLAKDVDVLIHEATFSDESEHLAGAYGHSTMRQAAEIANVSNANYLIAQHISSRFMANDLKTLESEGKEVFPNMWIANDFDQFELRNGKLMKKSSEHQ